MKKFGWYLLITTIVLLLISKSAGARIVRNTLGDINRDGIKEIAVEDWSSGSGGNFAIIKICSGKKIVLDNISLSGGTADGYKVVGNQIVVWQGNWQTGSKQDPHYYNFSWYSWDKQSKMFKVCREGFTKRHFSYKQAKAKMTLLAADHGNCLVLSNYPTFSQEAGILAAVKYRQKLVKVSEVTQVEPWDPQDGRWFVVELERKKGSPVIMVDVSFRRDSGAQVKAVTD